MLNLTIDNRPFATEPITGLMLPDGIFEAALGAQRINAHVRNSGAAVVTNAQVYVESVSHPGIVVTPATYGLPSAAPGVSHLFAWDANFGVVPAGKYLISFIIRTATEQRRVIKKIFVTRISFNAANGTFRAQAPEGVLEVEFKDMVRPRDKGCCGRKRPSHGDHQEGGNLFRFLKEGFRGHDPDFRFCIPEYLPRVISAQMTATPPFAGLHGDLPYQDPWWKVLLCILAFVLLVAAAIAEAEGGSGSVSTTGGPGGGGSSTGDCCGLEPSGGGTSYVAAGLVAAAAAAATAAALSDAKDPFRKGEDATVPAAGEMTTAEHLDVEFSYGEPVALGRPFTVGAKWNFARVTTGALYNHSATEANANIHTVSHYEVKAPDVVRAYRRELWVVEASFTDADGTPFRGDQLFAQCFLIGPAGQLRRLVLQDNGVDLDKKPLDGIYTGGTYFSMNDRGLWTYFVIVQDVNNAKPDMKPEEAAQIIGGMVLTHQLTLTFDGGICDLVADGHVNVV